MGRMADTVVKNQREAELALDRAVLRQEAERIQRLTRDEERKKLAELERQRKVQEELQSQLAFKQKQRE
jgi:hypothetical protein